MSAAALLALTMLLHARHVIRDAEGLLPRRGGQAQSRETETAAAAHRPG